MSNNKDLETGEEMEILEEGESKKLETIEEIEVKEKKKYKIDKELEEILRDKPEGPANYNFLISQNKVIFVGEITKEQIKNGGKFCKGENYQTGETVQILDKDYGKSAELLRALLEKENSGNFKRILILSILGIAGFVIIAFFISLIIPGDSKQSETSLSSGFLPKAPTQINTGSTEQTKKNLDIDMTTNKISSPKSDELGSFEEQPQVNAYSGQYNNTQLFSQNNNVGYNTQIPNNSVNMSQMDLLDKNYELEVAKLEFKRLQNENDILTKKYNDLLKESENKDKTIDELKISLKSYTDIPKNLTQEAFLLHLGTKIYEQCEKTEIEVEKNKCKDLYFEYVSKK